MIDEPQNNVPTDQNDLQSKCDEYLTGWKRALADYDNLKKDLGRERGEMRLSALADAAMRMIPVLDNFDAATRFVPAEIDDKLKNWLNGILFIRAQLEGALKDMGVEPFGAVGEAFDANRHEAVGGEGATVSEVVARGWKIGERIVRPAKVIVK
jgi:molecular chaperone GrpE